MTTIQTPRVSPLHAIDATSLPTIEQANKLSETLADDNLIRAYRAAGHLRAYADEAGGTEWGDTTAAIAALYLADLMHLCDALHASAEQHEDRDTADQAWRVTFGEVLEAARVHYNAERDV